MNRKGISGIVCVLVGLVIFQNCGDGFQSFTEGSSAGQALPSNGGDPVGTTVPGLSTPEIVILGQPPAILFFPSAEVSFDVQHSESQALESVSCSLDSSPFTACASPVVTPDLQEGIHRLTIRALVSGQTVETSVRWNVDLTPVGVAFTSVPPSFSFSNEAMLAFQFSADPSEVVSLVCTLNDSPFEPCQSPIMLSDLLGGDQVFQVEVTDAGNRISSTSYAWTIDDSPVYPGSGPMLLSVENVVRASDNPNIAIVSSSETGVKDLRVNLQTGERQLLQDIPRYANVPVRADILWFDDSSGHLLFEENGQLLGPGHLLMEYRDSVTSVVNLNGSDSDGLLPNGDFGFDGLSYCDQTKCYLLKENDITVFNIADKSERVLLNFQDHQQRLNELLYGDSNLTRNIRIGSFVVDEASQTLFAYFSRLPSILRFNLQTGEINVVCRHVAENSGIPLDNVGTNTDELAQRSYNSPVKLYFDSSLNRLNVSLWESRRAGNLLAYVDLDSGDTTLYEPPETPQLMDRRFELQNNQRVSNNFVGVDPDGYVGILDSGEMTLRSASFRGRGPTIYRFGYTGVLVANPTDSNELFLISSNADRTPQLFKVSIDTGHRQIIASDVRGQGPWPVANTDYRIQIDSQGEKIYLASNDSVLIVDTLTGDRRYLIDTTTNAPMVLPSVQRGFALTADDQFIFTALDDQLYRADIANGLRQDSTLLISAESPVGCSPGLSTRTDFIVNRDYTKAFYNCPATTGSIMEIDLQTMQTREILTDFVEADRLRRRLNRTAQLMLSDDESQLYVTNLWFAVKLDLNNGTFEYPFTHTGSIQGDKTFYLYSTILSEGFFYYINQSTRGVFKYELGTNTGSVVSR